MIDWEGLTGQSRFVIELVSFPIFSALAGLLTNWTGVLMLFAPARFQGYPIPGLHVLYPYLPRRVQVLPIYSGDGRKLGFQGFIPARAEKIASLCVDMTIMRIGSLRDFIRELDLDGIADHVAELARDQVRPMVDTVIEREHPDLWPTLPPQVRQLVYDRVERELPAACRRGFDALGDSVDELIDVKGYVIRYLNDDPTILKTLIQRVAAPELAFMTRIGLLGAPFGLLLALYLHVHHSLPVVGAIPAWVVVLTASALIGVVVNMIAVKMVFEPGEPAPRYRYPWRQALLARRQPQAAADFAYVLAHDVLTVPNLAHELLWGSRGDKTRRVLERVISQEIHRQLGPAGGVVRAALGSGRLGSFTVGAADAAVSLTPTLVSDKAFTRRQADRIADFATSKLRSMNPSQFMEMFYASIEQDAWLIYLHGAVLGLGVGAVHLALFGA